MGYYHCRRRRTSRSAWRRRGRPSGQEPRRSCRHCRSGVFTMLALGQLSSTTMESPPVAALSSRHEERKVGSVVRSEISVLWDGTTWAQRMSRVGSCAPQPERASRHWLKCRSTRIRGEGQLRCWQKKTQVYMVEVVREKQDNTMTMTEKPIRRFKKNMCLMFSDQISDN